MSTYSVFEARNGLSRLIAEARSGAEVVIANRGEPVVKLVPVAPAAPDTSGVAAAAWLAAHPLPARLARPADELDSQIVETRGSWE